MARIPLTAGFQIHPEGEFVFTISEVKYDADFGTLELVLKSDKGTINKKYNLLAADGSMNTGACNSFSYLARNAMNNWEAEDIDPDELAGLKFRATVVHDKRPSTKDPSKTVTWCNLDAISPAEGGYDLDNLLG